MGIINKSIKTIVTVLAITAFPYTGIAQTTKILTADKHNEYGLIYTLPVTALEIEVTARQTVCKAGPYYQYAKKFIGADNVIKEDSESWEITGVNVKRYGIPDSSKRYLMQLKPGATTYISVSDDGMLQAINREVEFTPENDEVNDIEEAAVRYMNEYLQYVDEDFIASQSSAKRAQLLAESLMEIRDAKVSLTRGTAETMPKDGKQLELMLSSLRHQEEALTAAFMGLSYTKTQTRKFTFTPAQEGKSTLFRLSDFSGFVGPDDYSGEPVYISVNVTGRGELPKDAKGEEKKLPKDAVVYNIPGNADIEITALGKVLYSKNLDFAQYGIQFGLAPILFSAKKNRSYAVFDSVTGALVEIGDDGEQ